MDKRKKWTSEEELILKNNYDAMSVYGIARMLNKSTSSVGKKAGRLGLRKRVQWTYEEELFLKDNYLILGKDKCATALNRSIEAVYIKARNLSLVDSKRTGAEVLNDFLNLLDNNGYQLIGDFINTSTKVLVKHTVCEHIWYTTPGSLRNSIRRGGTGCPKCSRKCNYSKVAIEWLNSFNNKNIQHAENGGEASVLHYKVDGYDQETNTVYEFHGDVYHGNLDKFPADYRCHPFNKEITAEELWQNTYDKMEELSKVATVVYIWEDDYRNGKPAQIF